MRTTVELPDDLLGRAKLHAAESGLTLKELFVIALEGQLSAPKQKTRRALPVFGGPGAPVIDVLTAEQIDDALFG